RDLRVELRSVPARTVVAIRGAVKRHDIVAWYEAAMTELDAAFPAAERTGPLAAATRTSCSPTTPGRRPSSGRCAIPGPADGSRCLSCPPRSLPSPCIPDRTTTSASPTAASVPG